MQKSVTYEKAPKAWFANPSRMLKPALTTAQKNIMEKTETCYKGKTRFSIKYIHIRRDYKRSKKAKFSGFPYEDLRNTFALMQLYKNNSTSKN